MKYFGTFCFVSLLTFCLALGAIGSYKEATDYSITIEQITAFIERRMREDQVTGLSIALVDGQKTVWSQGFGFADKEKGIEASPETIYEIGSISKTITATAIMRLQEQGLINIDRPLTEYLPEFSILPPQSGRRSGWSFLTARTGGTSRVGTGALVRGIWRRHCTRKTCAVPSMS